ncbi:hypothetical protein ACFLTR_01660 [Chloroflexota bacterium]
MDKPAVVLGGGGFEFTAKSTASLRGIPGLRFVAETLPDRIYSTEEALAGIRPVIDDIVAALTKPLTEEERHPKKEVKRPPRIVFKGNLEEFNRFFYKSGWTDGLPVVPPTEEAVKEMLTGTNLPPEHVVTRLIPRMGKATVEKIAVNAVMAGALPTHMPVLIAGVQALMNPLSFFQVKGVSTSSWSPFWMINGPVAKDLNVNRGQGALNPGNIANAAIGRAMGLIIKNIGGIRKGIEDMAVLGNPGKYSTVIAENEEASPWEPLHVERGLNKEDSAVTLCFYNCFVQYYPTGTEAVDVLKGTVDNVPPGGSPGRWAVLLMPPSLARKLADEGWTKKDVKRYIAENTSVPAYKHPYRWFGTDIRKEFKAFIPPHETDPMVLFWTPEHIQVVVVSESHIVTGMALGFSHYGPPQFATQKVELPANWKELVAKYKDIVPAYVRY